MSTQHHGRSARRSARRAFTLIELMIVVAIVGILATLAIVGYRKLILASHTSEATHMVQSIRVAEEAYHAEAQTYVSTGPTHGTGFETLYPNASPHAVKTNWTTPATIPAAGCTPDPTSGVAAGVANCFGLLPVHTDGPVAYGYETMAGGYGSQPTGITAGTVAIAAGVVTTDWYWITAEGNYDNQTNPALFSYVVGNSLVNDLYVVDQ